MYKQATNNRWWNSRWNALSLLLQSHPQINLEVVIAWCIKIIIHYKCTLLHILPWIMVSVQWSTAMVLVCDLWRITLTFEPLCSTTMSEKAEFLLCVIICMPPKGKTFTAVTSTGHIVSMFGHTCRRCNNAAVLPFVADDDASPSSSAGIKTGVRSYCAKHWKH